MAFICYRRSDTADTAGRIRDRLVEHFGRQRVLQDVHIEQYKDWRLRSEIRTALQHEGVTVAPVLVGATEMPTEQERPEEIRALAHKQAISLSIDRRFDRDSLDLVTTLEWPTHRLARIAQHVGASLLGGWLGILALMERVEAFAHWEGPKRLVVPLVIAISAVVSVTLERARKARSFAAFFCGFVLGMIGYGIIWATVRNPRP